VFKSIFSLIIMATLLQTASKVHAEAPAHDEKPKEGAAPAAGNAKGPELPEWSDLLNKVAATKAKIVQKEDVIKKLVLEKSHASSEHSQYYIKQLIEEHKLLNELKAHYEKQRSLFKYRYPEKFRQEGRKYDRMKVQTLEEMETQMGIDGQLDRSLKRVRSKFGEDPTRKEIEKTRAAKPKSEESIDESGPIILEK
jgi:hypothetical protein